MVFEIENTIIDSD
jgi:hypothetical protein